MVANALTCTALTFAPIYPPLPARGEVALADKPTVTAREGTKRAINHTGAHAVTQALAGLASSVSRTEQRAAETLKSLAATLHVLKALNASHAPCPPRALNRTDSMGSTASIDAAGNDAASIYATAPASLYSSALSLNTVGLACDGGEITAPVPACDGSGITTPVSAGEGSGITEPAPMVNESGFSARLRQLAEGSSASGNGRWTTTPTQPTVVASSLHSSSGPSSSTQSSSAQGSSAPWYADIGKFVQTHLNYVGAGFSTMGSWIADAIHLRFGHYSPASAEASDNKMATQSAAARTAVDAQGAAVSGLDTKSIMKATLAGIFAKFNTFCANFDEETSSFEKFKERQATGNSPMRTFTSSFKFFGMENDNTRVHQNGPQAEMARMFDDARLALPPGQDERFQDLLKKLSRWGDPSAYRHAQNQGGIDGLDEVAMTTHAYIDDPAEFERTREQMKRDLDEAATTINVLYRHTFGPDACAFPYLDTQP